MFLLYYMYQKSGNYFTDLGLIGNWYTQLSCNLYIRILCAMSCYYHDREDNLVLDPNLVAVYWWSLLITQMCVWSCSSSSILLLEHSTSNRCRRNTRCILMSPSSNLTHSWQIMDAQSAKLDIMQGLKWAGGFYSDATAKACKCYHWTARTLSNIRRQDRRSYTELKTELTDFSDFSPQYVRLTVGLPIVVQVT